MPPSTTDSSAGRPLVRSALFIAALGGTAVALGLTSPIVFSRGMHLEQVALRYSTPTSLLLFAAIAIGIFLPGLGERTVHRSLERLRPLIVHRWLPFLVVGCVALLLCAILGLAIHFPLPSIQDEFSYLLSGDTFGLGRLTNPTHPMWRHFETFQVIQHPTYQSKYPPSQGLFLALGQALTGRSIAGVWLSFALACIAVVWMLDGWLPRRWALLGGLIALCNPMMVLWWGQSYWGGAGAMLGGALVYGSLPRIMRRRRPLDGIWLGVGVAILAISRPLEGTVFAIPAAIWLLAWFIRSKGDMSAGSIARLITPLSCVLLLAFAWMAYYNSRVTGHALKMPYQVWLEQHGLGLAEAALSTVKTESQTAVGKARSGELWRQELAIREDQIRSRRSLPYAAFKLERQYLFFFGMALTPALLMLPSVLRVRRNLLLTVPVAATLAVVLLNSEPGFPHYLAPATCLLIFISVQGLRYLRHLKLHDREIGGGIGALAADHSDRLLGDAGRLRMDRHSRPPARRVGCRTRRASRRAQGVG